jgi:hypothetical protein
MADYAVAFDERPDTATYTSVIINRVPYDKTEDTEAKGLSKCARLLRGRFAARIWAPIRGTERFKAAVGKMAECAESFDEDGE